MSHAVIHSRDSAHHQTDSSPPPSDGLLWRIFKYFLLAVAALISLILVSRLLYWIMIQQLYAGIFQAVRGTLGTNDLITSAITVWLVYAAILCLPTIFYIGLAGKLKKTLAIGVGIVSVAMVIQYFLSLPPQGQYFNPYDSRAYYKYAYWPGGRLVLYPLGYNFDPYTQQQLYPITRAIVAEYKRQQAADARVAEFYQQETEREAQYQKEQAERAEKWRQEAEHRAYEERVRRETRYFWTEPRIGVSSKYAWDERWQANVLDRCHYTTYGIRGASGPSNIEYGPFSLWVERVRISDTDNATYVRIGIKSWDNVSEPRLFHSFALDYCGYTRLWDSKGRYYKLVKDHREYSLPVTVRNQPGSNPLQNMGLKVDPGWWYWIELEFPMLVTYQPGFILEMPHFPQVTIHAW